MKNDLQYAVWRMIRRLRESAAALAAAGIGGVARAAEIEGRDAVRVLLALARGRVREVRS